MHFKRSKSSQQHSKNQQKMMQLPNESVLSDTSNIRDNPHDLSISTIDSSPRVEKSKGAQFFGKLWTSAVNVVKVAPASDTSKLSSSASSDQQSSPTLPSPYRRSVLNAKKEVDTHRLRAAKRILREIHELRKEQTITKLIEDQVIHTEEEAQVVEDDMDTKYVEEYGSDGASDLEDEIMGSDQICEGDKARQPEYESVADVSSIDIKNTSGINNRKLATEASPHKPNHFSIDELSEDSHYLPTDPTATKNSTKENLQRPSLDLVEVYQNQLSSAFIEETSEVQSFFSKEEEINIKAFEKYEVNRNAFASGLTNFLNKDKRQVFIYERNFYVAKKTYGSFAVIEAAYPLSRLAKIYIHDKSKILKFSFVDDESPGFETIDETFQLKNCNALVADVQKNLQGINSSIRIYQSGYSFE